MINQESIEQVLNRTDIVEIVREYIPELKRKGSNYTSCCPFHSEKTPSFVVSPARGTWHCFGSCGEGGNAIGFVMKAYNMTFPEAVKKLAAQCGVEIEDEQETPEQIQSRLKRETLLIINEKAQDFFVKSLENSDKAKKYISSRWDMTFAKILGIGYAPDSWDGLYNYAIDNGMNIELMKEIGLIKDNEKGKIYDFYRDRIVIPIRDRFRNIIGFTARDISGKDDVAKYLNSATSCIYNKDNSLFGIDVAIKEAVKEDKIYAVEGAPDVLRFQSIKKYNCVASLGTAWTKKQFEQIKNIATKICFLPDADTVKSGNKYGAGITAVMKNGKLAIQNGLTVSVKEIPLTAENKKNDPDSYILNQSILNGIQEEDFIEWLGRHLFESAETTFAKNDVITEISELLALIEDNTSRDMYITALRKYYNPLNIWKQKINEAREKNRCQKKEKKIIDRDAYIKYGFSVNDNSYESIGGKNGPERWSNFVMTPMFHIRDAIMPKRLYKIKNQFNIEEIIELKQEDLVSLSKFKQKVEGLGNYIWLAQEKELTKLKMYLYEQTETATEITQLGWNRKGFFAFGNGIFTTEWIPTDEYGIVRIEDKGNFYIPSNSKIYKDEPKLFQFERRFVHMNYNNITLKEYFASLIDVFGDNAIVGIGFLLATLFRDIVTGFTKSFPILNLFGPKGSGKSELGHSLMAFFIIDNTPPNIQNATIAALADTVAQCSNALVHIDEFKNTIDIDKREFLKGLWDGAGRSRMNMDRDKKREITSVDCGVILSGQEMATADIALFSRLLYLTFSKSDFTNDAKAKFNRLVETRKRGLTHLTLLILRHRRKMETQFASAYNKCMTDVVERLDDRIEDRILRNWLIPLATFNVLETVLDFPFYYKDLLEITIEGIKRQNAECKSNNELANFWNVVSFLQQEGEIFNEADYHIKYVNKLKTNVTQNEIQYKEAKPVLMLRKNRIFMLYKKYGKMVGDSILPESSLKYYLENSKEYLGIKDSVRFKNIIKGVEQTVTTGSIYDKNRKFEKATTVDQALCFDYILLRNSFSINLEIELVNEFDEINKEE